MQWTPEIALDLDRVRALVARDLPEWSDEPLAVVGEGWDNLAVRVGDHAVLRLARREIAARLLEREARFVPLVARDIGVPVSDVIRYVPARGDHPFPYAAHRWIEGETGCRATDIDWGALATTLGRAVGAIHRVPVPDDAPGDELGRGDHVKRGTRAVARLAELGVDVSIAEWLAAPPDEGPRVWVHGDLYGRHLLFRGGQLAGIIDWGDVHAGSPATDLAVAYSFLPADVRGAFFAAYGREVDEAAHLRARAIALDYAGALVPYGRATGDGAAEALGWRAFALSRT